MTFRIMTLSIKSLFVTLSIDNIQHKLALSLIALCIEWRLLSVIMLSVAFFIDILNVIMLSVITLSVIMLSAIMLSAIMLRVAFYLLLS